MTDLLFDTPWWLPTLIALVGIVLFVRGNRNQNAILRTAGGAVLSIALLLILVSYFVDTDKEICINRTRQLVRAVEQGEWKTFEAMLDPGATLELQGNPYLTGRDSISKTAQAGVQRIGLKSVTMTGKHATQTADSVTVSFRVFTEQEYTLGRPVDSDWEIDWQKSSGVWRARRIREINVAGATPQALQHELPKPR